MPRGRQIFPLQVPTQGLILNVPINKVGLDGLIDGENMYLDTDGLYRCRHGYQPMVTDSKPGFRIMGGYWFKDSLGIERFIAVGQHNAAALVNGVWEDITGDEMNGREDDPVEFAEVFQNGKTNVVWTNFRDPMKIWNPDMPKYFDLTPIYLDETDTNDQLVLTADQVTKGPSGTQLFVRPNRPNFGPVTATITWAGEDPPREETLPVKKIVDGLPADLEANDLLAGQLTNLVLDVGAPDYLRLYSNQPAPICRDIAVINNRLVAYNVWHGDVHSPPGVDWSRTYDVTQWPMDNYFLLTDSNDPGVAVKQFGNQAGLLYGEQSIWIMRSQVGLDSQAWQFNRVGSYQPGPVGTAAIGVIQQTHYFLAVDGRIWQIDPGLAPQPIGDRIYPLINNELNKYLASRTHAVYYPALRQIWWWFPLVDQTDPHRAVCMRVTDLAFETGQSFIDGISASWHGEELVGATWLSSPNPWDTYLAPWNRYTARAEIAVFLGTVDGQVMRFGTDSASDDGQFIPYSMIPGLMTLGPSNNVIPDSLELFVATTGIQEFLTMSFSERTFPIDVLPQLLFDMPIQTDEARTYALAALLPTEKRTFRWLQLRFFGRTNSRAFSFGGGNVFAYQEERGSREGS